MLSIALSGLWHLYRYSGTKSGSHSQPTGSNVALTLDLADLVFFLML